jgi:hypothetical protein
MTTDTFVQPCPHCDWPRGCDAEEMGLPLRVLAHCRLEVLIRELLDDAERTGIIERIGVDDHGEPIYRGTRPRLLDA